MPLYILLTDYVNQLQTDSTVTNHLKRSNEHQFELNSFTTTVFPILGPPAVQLENADTYYLSITNDNPFQTNKKNECYCKPITNLVPTKYGCRKKFFSWFNFVIFCSHCESIKPFFFNYTKLFSTFSCNEQNCKNF